MPEASFQDLQTAITGFNDQVKSYAVQSAVTNASQQVQDLSNAKMDEMDKRNQLQQLSGQLAMQLTGLGASGAQISGAMAATQPKPLDTYGQMYAEGLTTGSEPLKKKAKELKTFMNEDKFALAQLKMQQDMLKLEKKSALQNNPRFSKLVQSASDKYNAWSNKFAPIESKLDMLENALIKGDNKMIEQSAPIALSRAAGEVGPLTETDKAPFQGSLALMSQLEAAFERMKSGGITPKNRQLVLDMVKKLKKANLNMKQRNTKTMSSQLSKHATKILNVPLDEDEASSYITGLDSNSQDIMAASPSSAPQQQGQQEIKKTSKYLSF